VAAVRGFVEVEKVGVGALRPGSRAAGLTGEISEICKKNGFAAAPTSWVAVTARAAASVLGQCLEVMDPKAALTMGFESAIYASKLPQPT